MQERDSPENNKLKKQLSSYVKYSALGFQMIVIIGIFTFAGYKIDQSLNHEVMWVTAILSLIGVFISLYQVIRSLKN
jgi:ATP synthase protein I